MEDKDTKTWACPGACRIVCIRTQELRDVNGMPFLLCTRLVETVTNGVPVFSFFVSKTAGRTLETAFVYAFTGDRAIALASFAKLVRGGVTPCALTETAAELMP